MQTSDFDYDLPRELIATHPAEKRDASRLLVMDKTSGAVQHRTFADLPEYLKAGDLLVMNDSRVLNARLHGTRRATGAGVEILLLEKIQPSAADADNSQRQLWRAMCRPAKKFRLGESIDFANGQVSAQVVEVEDEGHRILSFNTPDVLPVLQKYGEIPLPPYIVQRRKETGTEYAQDSERYQTVYSAEAGSVAAPTAGLHFTPGLLQQLSDAGVSTARVTLHVGPGTFKPVEVENAVEHPIHSEYCEVPTSTAEKIAATRKAGGRIVAVGTTTVRTLESAWDEERQVFRDGRFATRLFIYPGYTFKVINAMITNFHLPRSSLLMMVSAFAGRDHILGAYDAAIANGYRFYSYGDATLLI